MKPNKCQNKSKEEKDVKGRDKKSPEKRNRAVGDAFAGRKKKTISRKHPRAGKPVYGIRGRTRKPEDVERISEEFEEYPSTTRYLESSLGIKSYSELAPHLAKGVERVMASLLNSGPNELIVTSEFICKLHRDAFGELFPDWAGHYRNRDVTVGKHMPPHYFEVPILMRQYCDNLESRLSPIGPKPSVNNILLETFAVAEGCFLSIHPFYDFNGRVARMLLFALLYRLDLPPVQLVPDEKDAVGKKQYLQALASADAMDWYPLVELWRKRFGVKG